MEFEPQFELNELTAYDAMLRFLESHRDIIRNRADLDDLLDEMRYGEIHNGAPLTLSPRWWSIWLETVGGVLGEAPAP
jgi:hypothetical protein